jgi:N6-adenosine-specific RNA methylase IME4
VRYSILLADPPWQYNDRKAVRKDGDVARFGIGASGRYHTEPTDQIANIPASDLALPDAQLYMWATWPFLPGALWLMEQWGFEYKTCAFVWVKANKGRWKASGEQLTCQMEDVGIEQFLEWMFFYGVGNYTASNTEFVLLGARGQFMKPVKKASQVIVCPGWNGGEHSRKPEEVHRRVEKMYPDESYAELFARRERPGWLCLGDELDGMDLRESIPLQLGEAYDAPKDVATPAVQLRLLD